MSTIVQTGSATSSRRCSKSQIASAYMALQGGESQRGSQEDDYDACVELISRAFSEIARLCFETDYKLDEQDWALLDAARLDPLPYEERRTVLRYVYKQIKRKAQARAVQEVKI